MIHLLILLPATKYSNGENLDCDYLPIWEQVQNGYNSKKKKIKIKKTTFFPVDYGGKRLG